MSGKPGVRPDPYKTWLCFYLACTLTGPALWEAKFIAQHKGESKQVDAVITGYSVVGRWLKLSAAAVAKQCNTAKKKLQTDEGKREYMAWLTYRDRLWWIHHKKSVLNMELPPLPMSLGKIDDVACFRIMTDAEIQDYVIEARQRLMNEEERGKRDYQEWLAVFHMLDLERSRMPREWHFLPKDSDLARAVLERRDANLELQVKGAKRGRKPRDVQASSFEPCTFATTHTPTSEELEAVFESQRRQISLFRQRHQIAKI